MIGFVTWSPFIIVYWYKKGGQVTKPIILVKMCYVIQGVIFIGRLLELIVDFNK